LSFSVPTPEAERLFLASFTATREQYQESLEALKGEHLHLVNTIFDTGKPARRGEYAMADETYDELLGRLAEHKFATASEALRSNLLAYYGAVDSLPASTKVERKRAATIRQQLAMLAEATAR
jgi:hypothetical protein